MPRKKGAPAARKPLSGARGIAGPGRLTDPQAESANAAGSEPLRYRKTISAPMHGTPLSEDRLDRLKEQAKWSPVSRGVGSQEDPSTKK